MSKPAHPAFHTLHGPSSDPWHTSKHAASLDFQIQLWKAVAQHELRPLTAKVLAILHRHALRQRSGCSQALLRTLAHVHMTTRARERGEVDDQTTRSRLRQLEKQLVGSLPLHLVDARWEGDPRSILAYILQRG